MDSPKADPPAPGVEADPPGALLPVDHGRWYEWLPLLAPPLGMLLVYAAHAAEWELLLRKSFHETLALVITPLAVAAAGWRWFRRRGKLDLVFTVFCLVVMLREIHFAGTSKGVYVALAGIVVWCALWRRPLKAEFWGRLKGRWIVIAAWGYLVAVLVQRRAFKFLPLEHTLKGPIEELLETIAHLLLLVAAAV